MCVAVGVGSAVALAVADAVAVALAVACAVAFFVATGFEVFVGVCVATAFVATALVDVVDEADAVLPAEPIAAPPACCRYLTGCCRSCI